MNAKDVVTNRIIGYLGEQTGIPPYELRKMDERLGFAVEGVAYAWIDARAGSNANTSEGRKKDANDVARFEIFQRVGAYYDRSPTALVWMLKDAILDDMGMVRESIKTSPLLGPIVDKMRERIPPEIKGDYTRGMNGIPETEVVDLLFNGLERMGRTPEGKRCIKRLITNLTYAMTSDKEKNSERIKILLKSETDITRSFSDLYSTALAQEFLSSPKWDQSYQDFKNNILTKDSSGRLTLKEGVSKEVRGAIGKILEMVPNVTNDEGAKLGIAIGTFQKILDDPKKRIAILPLLGSPPKDPEQRKAWEESRNVANQVVATAAMELIATDETVRGDIFKGFGDKVKGLFTGKPPQENGQQSTEPEKKETKGGFSGWLSQLSVSHPKKSESPKGTEGGLSGRLSQVTVAQTQKVSPTLQTNPHPENIMTLAATRRLTDRANN